MKLAAIALTVASLSFASAAQASTVGAQASAITPFTVSAVRAPDAFAAVDITRSGALPAGATWQTDTEIWQLPRDFPIVPTDDNGLTDPCGNACSPFYFGTFGTPPTGNLSEAGVPGWETASFWTVFAPKPDEGEINQAVLGFGSIQSSFSLLWGSPDRTNLIEFFLGKKAVGSFWGKEFEMFGEPDIIRDPGQGAVLTSFNGLNFDSVRFTAYANGGSFEFSNITAQPAPVPLPAGVVLLLTGIATVAGVARRRARG